MVGLGLETLDDFIRNDVNGKALRLDDFYWAVEGLARARLSVYAYIILKLPGLLENEAIDECVRTAAYFFDLAGRSGVPYSRVNIKPFFVPRGTIAEKLFEEGLAYPPTLWSLVEAHKQIQRYGLIFSPLTDEGLSDGRFARNCPECTPRVIEAIHRFNRTNKIEPLDSIEPCGCKGEIYE
jgi:radical SAM enzyme (TIGR01210 family)